MQHQLDSQCDIIRDHISVATGIVPVLYKVLILQIFAKNMRVAMPLVSAVPIRHVGFSERN